MIFFFFSINNNKHTIIFTSGMTNSYFQEQGGDSGDSTQLLVKLVKTQNIHIVL